MSATDEAAPLTRRVLARAVGSLAVAAVSGGAFVEPAAGAAPLTRDKRKRGRHWHRCKRHRWHTCRRKNRCRHRNHRAKPKPATPAPEPPPAPKPPPTPPPPGSAEQVDLHLLSRLTYGYTPELGVAVLAAGGTAAWFEAQLSPSSIPDTDADELDTWWQSLSLDHTALWERDQAETEQLWEAMQNYARWCLLRRIRSQRQVFEVMAEFWENHLHVPLHDDGVGVYRADYGRTLRRHALGRYDDMLVAAITHPAMSISLDNANSTKTAPNENLGRELLELHTVGKGNHSEDDVKNSARILTGYRVDMWRTWTASYSPRHHWTGPVTVLDFHHANADTDGRAVVDAYLRHLARHPSTASRIARKLAVRFVSDTPSVALVEQLATTYLAHDTAIAPVLRALVATEEFRDSVGAKVRTPTDDVVATHRAVGSRITRPTGPDSAANAILWQATSIGQGPFEWGRPDGPPDHNAAWSSASRVLASFQEHFSIAGGWWPSEDVTYRTAEAWLPAPSVRFDTLVDHLSHHLFGKPATPVLQTACATALSLDPGTTITADHQLIGWMFPALLGTLLDSPEHLHR